MFRKQGRTTKEGIMTITASAQPQQRQWLAQLDLTFSQTAHGSRLSHIKRNGPLSVQKAFYPEGPDCAHVYLLHPPAGIVSGDELYIIAKTEENSQALLTTPGANRFYRARENAQIGHALQLQDTAYTVAANSRLEHLPQETLIYPNANAKNNLTVHVDKQGVYLGWDVISLGLPAIGKEFEQGKFEQLTQIYIDNKLAIHDRLVITPENKLLLARAGLANKPIIGTFYITAPSKLTDKLAQQDLLDALRLQVEQAELTQKVSISLIEDVYVIRYLGQRSAECKKIFIALWQTTRQALYQSQVAQPRIWLT